MNQCGLLLPNHGAIIQVGPMNITEFKYRYDSRKKDALVLYRQVLFQCFIEKEIDLFFFLYKKKVFSCAVLGFIQMEDLQKWKID